MKRLPLFMAGPMLLLTACATSPAKFYTLDAQAPAREASGQAVPAIIVISHVSVPELVDRPQFVLRIDATRIRIDEYSRWAEPLKEQIARVLAADLALSFPGALVSTSARWEDQARTHQVSVEVQGFESTPGDNATIAVLWTVRYPGKEDTRSGRSIVREPVKTQENADLVQAHSRALAGISADIARAIQAKPPLTPSP
ncbi:PqiC family protein [Achromobacter aloeverae]|uniref:ABC-type transport auxiliary lipoprotein component domain-containing protein n=1 Tax=Achromobacter aloeverae TaxID=1750518 RepID=A0A4Q1HFK6_9BURK|nr:PqiC family protein [Achromobacter aloeverae]RXN84510.1 hypothetical protein C7R54_24340 [Achromobacter aloeverae]